MINIIDFPRKPPAAAQLRAVAAELAQVLQVVADELVDQGADFKDVNSASEFASVVHSTANKLAETSEHWKTLSTTIRDHWK